MTPTAYRPTPRQREHRALVRHRAYVQQRLTAVRNKIRRVLSHYNLDRKDLFTVEGLAWLVTVAVSASDRFILEQLRADLDHHRAALAAADRRLEAFGQEAPPAEARAREVLASIPRVGPVTVDVVVSELGDIGRFRSQKQVAAYARLAPGRRESAGRTKALGITKEGSRLLRWVLVEATWRQVAHSRRRGEIYAGLKKRCGAKRAAVAVARRLPGVMASLLRSGQDYRLGAG
jgi:transposase